MEQRVDLSKKYEIEELSIELSITMDKIIYLDRLLTDCKDKVKFDTYLDRYDNEVKEHFIVRDKLLKNLNNYVKEEKEANLPINMAYRLLLKVLKET